MMRETRTLKGLFPDPKPQHSKNFIKENVKSLRRMEHVFHNNNKSAKDVKLPALKEKKNLSKHNGVGDNQDVNIIEGLQKSSKERIENGTSKSFNKQFLLENHKTCNYNTCLIPNVKYSQQKKSKPSVHGNIRDHYKNQINTKIDNEDQIKAYSEGDVHTKLNKIEIKDESIKNSKHQAVQTLDTNDLNSLYAEGIIKYPSEKTKETQRSKSLNKNNITQATENSEFNIKNGSECSLNNGIDYVKSNKECISVASKLASRLNNSTPRQNYRIGVVPKYIKERKEALRKEQAEIAAKRTDCPSGHVPVPDNERVKTLNLLKKNHDEFVSELNMLPIRTDTLRSHKRKMEIEKQLTKLEEAIKIFSRPKVFVKIDS